MDRLEKLVSWLILIASVALHIIFFFHAGGLWRDEANSLALAKLPTFLDNWNAVRLDAHPVGYSVLLKPFVAIGGDNDSWLRMLGCLTGIFASWSVWRMVRIVGGQVPLLFFGLWSLNAITVPYTSSLRPYGLSIVALALFLILMWRFAEDGKIWRLIGAFVLAFIAVHCHYANLFLILTATAGLSLSGRFEPEKVRWVLCCGMLPCLSLLCYLPSLHEARSWADMLQSGFSWQRPFILIESYWQAPGVDVGIWWMGGFLLTIGSLFWLISQSQIAASRQRSIMAGVFLLLPLPATMALLASGKTLALPWYFVSPLVPVVFSGDVLIGLLLRNGLWLRVGRLALTCFICSQLFLASKEMVEYRQTNIDLIAEKLNVEAQKNDLILVGDWVEGVSFSRYYRGTAPWQTIPPLADHSIHRFDLAHRGLGHYSQLAGYLARMESTLRGGGRIWIVGDIGLDQTKARQFEAFKPNAPLHNYAVHTENWKLRVAQLLYDHGGKTNHFWLPEEQPVSSYENPPLFVINGWRD